MEHQQYAIAMQGHYNTHTYTHIVIGKIYGGEIGDGVVVNVVKGIEMIRTYIQCTYVHSTRCV